MLVLAFGIFDLFDGTLARATGKATKLGAFLDSTFDRAGEAIVYLGIAAGLPGRRLRARGRAGRVGDGRGVHGQLHAGQG